jgi:hypothetical protein
VSALTLGVLASSLTHSRDARASDPPAAAPRSPARSTRSGDFLVWQAPPGCSSAAALHERVRELLGEPELDLKRVQRVEGRVSESQGGWTLHLRLVDALGPRERELHAERCTDLAEAAAVAITLAFEAARSREAALTAKSAEPATAAPASENARGEAAGGGAAASPGPALPELSAAHPDDAAQSAADAPEGDARPRYALGAEFVVDVGTLPVTALGVSLFGALHWSELRLALYGLALPDADKSVGPGQSVAFALASVGLRAGYAIGHGWVDTLLCAGIEAGRVSAHGTGLSNARSVRDLWLAPHAGLELSAQPGAGVSLFVRGEAVVPLLRQRYAVNDRAEASAEVDTISGIGARLAAGALIAF